MDLGSTKKCIHYNKVLILYIDSDCGDPLLEKAVLRATSSLPDRGPENAVLNGKYTFVFQFFVFRINI